MVQAGGERATISLLNSQTSEFWKKEVFEGGPPPTSRSKPGRYGQGGREEREKEMFNTRSKRKRKKGREKGRFALLGAV